MDNFTKAYIEAALWSTTDDGDCPLDAHYTVDDMSPETLAKMQEDCYRFQLKNQADLSRYTDPRWSPEELGGHDLWLTRNHHGAGFWDRDSLPESVKERLTDAAHACGTFDLYVGDDGMIHGN
jgi:hypothetical protein